MVQSRKARPKDGKSKESGNWKPGNWKPEKVGRVVRRAYRVAMDECEQLLGPHDGRAVAARLRSERDEVKSVAELRARGVPLLGDSQSAR